MNIIVRNSSEATGLIQVSGDKSVSHRALLVGATARGKTTIKGYSQGDDCWSTYRCLRGLGVDIQLRDGYIEIDGKGIRGFNEPNDILDCGNSGTTMRLLSGLLCGQNFTCVLTGDDSLRNRPMKRVIEPLTAMNGRILSRTGGRAPLSIQGSALKAIDYTLPVASAQVKSTLLFAGLLADGITTVEEPVATRDHTERMLVEFGADLKRRGNKIQVAPGGDLHGCEVCVPGDISSAAFFVVLASIVPGSRITVQNTGVNPTRTGIIDALRAMGGDVREENTGVQGSEPVADLKIAHQPLQAIHIKGDMVPRVIDELPIIAVAATQAEGITRVSDARELRYKETDRIKAIVQGLRHMGAAIHELEDGFTVEGPVTLHGAVCQSYNDHRIAMALVIAGLVARGETVVQNADCIKISFPEFVSLIEKVCGGDAIRISE